MAQTDNGIRQDVAARTAGYNGKLYRLRYGFKVGIQTVLGCFVVIRGNQKQSVHPVLFCFSGKINGCLGTVGTGTCHNGDSARYLFRAIFNHIQMFFMRQCGRFSCGTAYNNGIGTVCNLEFNHFRKLFVIYLTVFLHGCYNGNTCTLKNRHTFPPYPLKMEIKKPVT